MALHSSRLAGLVVLLLAVLLYGAAPRPGTPSAAASAPSRMQKRWLFIWRDMSDPKEVDRMIARFPRARADGYNGVAFYDTKTDTTIVVYCTLGPKANSDTNNAVPIGKDIGALLLPDRPPNV